ncbi:MAG: prepilin peptidase [Pseudomonadota bacterium]
MLTHLLIISIFPMAMAFAAAYDLFSMTLPNWISLVLVAGFAVLAPLVGIGWSAAGLHVALAFAALVVTFGMFSMGWIGGGDAKLFAATCLWLGPDQMLIYAIYAALLGGLLTFMLLVVRQMPLPASFYSQQWIARLHDSNEGVPYGIALAAAGLLVYPETAFMNALGG